MQSLPTWPQSLDVLAGLTKLVPSGSACLTGVSSRLLATVVKQGFTRLESPETQTEWPGRPLRPERDSDWWSCTLMLGFPNRVPASVTAGCEASTTSGCECRLGLCTKLELLDRVVGMSPMDHDDIWDATRCFH